MEYYNYLKYQAINKRGGNLLGLEKFYEGLAGLILMGIYERAPF
jgi:hypothetical protein